MKLELSADLAKMVSELLHEYQESVAYDEAFASYCSEVAYKFDAAVEQAKKERRLRRKAESRNKKERKKEWEH